MKKLKLKRNSKAVTEQPSRITNETVAEHREQVLAGGRRFKYPRQIARHKLVFNAILISVGSVILLTALGWWQLYLAQNTSTFFYRVTHMVPVPVATIDGKQVRYSDYLLLLNGSTHYLEQTERLNLDTDDGKRQVEFMKRQALDGAVADSYAEKLAEEKEIAVSDEEIDAVIDQSLTTVNGRISKDVYNNSTLSTLGYTAEEYRHIIERSLLRQKVSYAIDAPASNAKSAAEVYLKSAKKPTLDELVTRLEKANFTVEKGASGLVPKTNHDGGLSQTAYNLKQGAMSQVVQSSSGDGYYILQLNSKNDRQLSYSFVKIPLSAFGDQLAALAKKGSINEFIAVKESSTPTIERK